MKRTLIALAYVSFLSVLFPGPTSLFAADDPAAENNGRISIDDFFRLGQVSEPRISPEGDWVAYTVTRQDLEEDKAMSRVWMVPESGEEAVALTAKDESSSQPRWSPDGKHLAFLSCRDEGETQVWTMYRGGGEATQVTETAQSVKAFEWSPDSGRMLLILQDPTAAELAARDQG